MTRPPLSVVTDSADPPPDPFQEWMRVEAHRALDRALAEKPQVLLIVYEAHDHNEPAVLRVPDSQCAQDGMIRALAEGRVNAEQ
jgi:hypothetical protein